MNIENRLNSPILEGHYRSLVWLRHSNSFPRLHLRHVCFPVNMYVRNP